MKDVVGGLNHRSGNTRTDGTTNKRTAKTIPIRDNRLLEKFDHPRDEHALPLSTVPPEPIPTNRNKSPAGLLSTLAVHIEVAALALNEDAL